MPQHAIPRRALVTGGGRGIGRAITHALVDDGFEVVVSSRHGDQLDETAATASDPRRVHTIPCDVTDRQACADLAASALAGGPITALVHNAGISSPQWLPGLTDENWDRHFDLNVTAPMILSRALVPQMAELGWGRVVSVGTIYSRFAEPGTSAYASSKHALLGFTRALAAEYAAKGVTANTIAPGYTDTEMMREHIDRASEGKSYDRDETIRRILRVQPIGRLIDPAETAGLISYLCSDRAGAITGQCINVDGGRWQG